MPTGDGSPIRSRRGTAVRIAIMVVLFAGVVFAVDQFDPGATKRLRHASAGWLAVALALELLACSSYVLLFQTVFSRSPRRVPTRRGLEIGLGELGAFAITPTGAGGPVLRIWGLRSSRMPWRALIVRSISHGEASSTSLTCSRRPSSASASRSTCCPGVRRC